MRQVRAKQNGVWLVVGNRWGSEPNFFPPPADYYMDDSPSAVFDPEGQAKIMYRADEEPLHQNRIVYYEVSIPKSRIGIWATNPTPTVQNRRVSAYGALTNNFYTPGNHNQPAPGLPPSGITRVQLLSYSPDPSPDANLKTLQGQVTKGTTDIVLMPGLGYTPKPIDLGSNPNWYGDPDWSRLANFAADRDLELLVTSAVEGENRRKNEALAVFQRGSNPRLIGQIHDCGSLRGTGEAPALIDL